MVRLIVDKYLKNGSIKRVIKYEKIIVDNLDYAKELYELALKELRRSTSLGDCKGFVELFEPKINSWGELLSCPMDNYIAREMYSGIAS